MTTKRTRARDLAWKIEHALKLLDEIRQLTDEIDIEIRRLSFRVETVADGAR